MGADPVLELRGAAVRGKRGTVFGPLDAESRGAVTVLLGGRGSGRTSLLLCLGGRMRLSEGSLAVLGETARGRARERAQAGRIRRASGVAGFEALDALEPAAALGDTLRERLAWASPWYRRIPRMTPERSRELLAPAFGGLPQPDPDALVRELNPADEMLVRIALALIEAPALLLVDDFDALRDPADRALVASRVAALAAGSGTAGMPGAPAAPGATPALPIVLATSDPGDVELLAAHGAAPSVIRL